jgi:hypothetical protein
MLRRSWCAVLLVLGLASVAHATVPSTLSYQGVLTDNLGAIQPDGLYNFTFKIYTVGSGGSAIWTETDNNVTLTKGSFTVLLGNVTPLNLAFDVPYYLGISVNGQPELTPRVALASSAYGLSLRLPFAGTDVSAGPLFAIHNTGGDIDIAADHWLQVGTPSTPGYIGLKSFGSPYDIASLYDYGSIAGAGTPGGIVAGGGALQLYDKAGVSTFGVEPDINGLGAGYLYVDSDGGTHSFVVDGNDGSGNPLVLLNGAHSITFSAGTAGDGSVVLPTDAIDSGEILDEPGIAQGHGNSIIVNLNTTPTDIIAVTLTIPAAGYIVVTADGQHLLAGNGANANYAHLYISETSGGAYDISHYCDSGWSSVSPSVTDRRAVSIHRTFFKSAGTYTFYFEGQAVNTAALSNYLWDATITASYFPTSYGGVTTLMSASEAAAIPGATRVTPVSGSDQPSGDVMLVDLRQLERQVASDRARLAESEARLRQAQDARQPRVSSAARARRTGGDAASVKP